MKTINLKSVLVAPILTLGFMATSAMALEITGSDVNMRASANATSDKVATLAAGTKCEDLGVDAFDSKATVNYHSVKCSVDGKEVIGFVKREATDLSAAGFDPKKSGKEMFIKADTDVNVRSGMSTKENNVISQIAPGTSIVAYETDAKTGMTRIAVNGSSQTAYISSKFLSADGSVATASSTSGPKMAMPTGPKVCIDKWPALENGDMDNNGSPEAKKIRKDLQAALGMRKITTGSWNLSNAEAGSSGEMLGSFGFELNQLNGKLQIELRSLTPKNMSTVSQQNNVDLETLQTGLDAGMLAWDVTKICQFKDNVYVVDLIGGQGAAGQLKGSKAQVVIRVTGKGQLQASGDLGGFEFEATAAATR